MYTKKWTPEEVLYLKEHYPVKPIELIANHLGRSVKALSHVVSSLRLKKYKNYSINKTFFNSWSSDMAYILGFIITDGCISGNRLSFGVAIKDKCVLDYIASKLIPGKAVSTYTEYRFGIPHFIARLKFGCSSVLNQLLNFGIIPRKTGKEILPDYIPKEYKADILRGIFDGDGCINISNKKTNQLRFHIVSASKLFLENVRERLGFGFGKIIQEKNKNYYRWIVYKQDDIASLASFMYYDNYPFCLERKRVIFHVNKSINLGNYGAGR